MTHAPLYWRDEVSGQLAESIMRYLENEKLSVKDVIMIRNYLVQWINADCWMENCVVDGQRAFVSNLRTRARTLRSRGEIGAWLGEAMAMGIDPL